MEPNSTLNIVELFSLANVECVIIGGHAVNYHGYPRSTQDVDLVFRRTASSDAAMYNVLAGINGYWISDQIDPKTGIEKTVPVSIEYIANHHLMMLGTDSGYVDLFDFIPGLPSEPIHSLFATAEPIGLLNFASLDWLRKMKTASARPQDLIDLAHLST